VPFIFTQASAYVPNWGQTIFQSAKEMASNAAFRSRLEDHQSKAAEEREWWSRKRASIQEGFMKELAQAENVRPASATKGSSTTTSGALPSAAAGQSTETSGVPLSTGSDDDAVLVESGGPAVAGTPGGTGGKKKKKGKK
jgi:translocation protein SEC66